MSQVITANYSTSSQWIIPNGIKLFSEEENNKPENQNKPGSWWIKWDILNYIDENGETQEIEPEYTASDFDYKRPTEIIVIANQ